MATRMMLPNVRLSYAQSLWTARPFDDTPGADKAWSCAFHLDKVKHADLIEAFIAAEFEEFEAKLPDKQKSKARSIFDDLGVKDRRIKDGDKTGDAEGCWIVSARATEGKHSPPLVLDRRRTRVAEGAEGAPYSGCFVNAQVEVWAQVGKYTRTNCTLLGVQFVKDGDAFGGGKPADPDAFADLGDQGEDEEELAGLA